MTTDHATIDTTNARRAQLRAAAEGYFTGLAQKDFESIPFAESVVLRAPLAPGGVNHPLDGRAALRAVWWPPIAAALGPVQVLDYYINDALTSICAAAEISVGDPPVVLRVVDRFIVDHAGRITEQENHFDPRDAPPPAGRPDDQAQPHRSAPMTGRHRSTAMPFIRTIPLEDATGPLKETYDREVKAQGRISPVTEAWSLRPAVLGGQVFETLMVGRQFVIPEKVSTGDTSGG